MDRQTYLNLLRCARKYSRRDGEAEDLLQSALLFAVEARRSDMGRSDNRRWLIGVLRHRALHEARTAARRRRREAEVYALRDVGAGAVACHEHLALTLPPALRTTALLALTGHTRPEIAWLLGLPDVTLRKRISDIGKRMGDGGYGTVGWRGGLRGDLAFGRIRQALIRGARRPDVVLGSHDPDGNLFFVTSQNPGPRQRGLSNI